MSSRTRVLSFLLLWFFAIAPMGAMADPLRLGSDRWPPFTDEAPQDRYAIDLVEAALARAEVEARTEILADFESVLDALKTGRLDGSPAIWRTKEREAFLVFSRPYLENRLVLLGRKFDAPGARGLADLAGKRIGIVAGYRYGKEVSSAQGPSFVRGASDQENLDRMMRGEVDFILADELIVHEMFEVHGRRADELLAAGSVTIAKRPLHFALGKRVPNAEAIIKRFDAAVLEMMANGSYNEILRLRWIDTDLDGDGRNERVLGGRNAGPEAPTRGYRVFEGEDRVPMGDAAAPGAAKSEEPGKFVVEGRYYDHWRDVPDLYKIKDEETRTGVGRGLLLLEF